MSEELIEVVKEALDHLDGSISCVEKAEDTLTNLVLWSRYLRDVVNTALAVHRSIILQGVLNKIPEPLRPAFMSTLMSVRKDLMAFTYLDDSCMNKISLAIMSSVGIAYRLLNLVGTNRYSVGIIRIASVLSRVKTDKGMYLDKETVIALLRELMDNVMSASMILGIGGSR